jgi:hypothetical protein
MTPEAQRVAIAKACEYDDIELRLICEGTGMDTWVWCSGIIDKGGIEIPDYLRDLNAMNRAEKRLQATERDTYARWLGIIVERERRMASIGWLCINAAPAQRAEAFLKTIGKWDDSK